MEEEKCEGFGGEEEVGGSVEFEGVKHGVILMKFDRGIFMWGWEVCSDGGLADWVGTTGFSCSRDEGTVALWTWMRWG